MSNKSNNWRISNAMGQNMQKSKGLEISEYYRLVYIKSATNFKNLKITFHKVKFINEDEIFY